MTSMSVVIRWVGGYPMSSVTRFGGIGTVRSAVDSHSITAPQRLVSRSEVQNVN